MTITRLTPRHKLTGWIRDTPDKRDLKYQAAPAYTLPFKVDLRPRFKPVPVEDQGAIGSCTAQALIGAMEYLNAQGDRPHVDFSRLFVYYGERYIEGTVRIDAGAQIRTGIRVLSKTGVCLESLWPYKTRNLYAQPDGNCFVDAKYRKAVEYRRCDGLTAVKTALSQGYPVSGGFMVYSNFESAATTRTGLVQVPKIRGFWRDRLIGGHAVCFCAYDDRMEYKGGRGCVGFRNSYGRGWGDDGHGWLPYPYLENPNLSDDFWVITRAKFEK